MPATAHASAPAPVDPEAESDPLDALLLQEVAAEAQLSLDAALAPEVMGALVGGADTRSSSGSSGGGQQAGRVAEPPPPLSLADALAFLLD